MSLLDIKSIDIYYGDVQVVYGVSLHIDESEIISIIGANGAGKSTILKCISGLINTKSGEMYFCLLYTSPSPRDATLSRMPSSA